jgi:adenylosuccinate lyase
MIMNSLQSDSFALSTLSPLDGRYRSGTAILAECFSEFALIQRRVRVEVAYLLFLSDEKLIPGFSDSAKKQLHTFATSLA